MEELIVPERIEHWIETAASEVKSRHALSRKARSNDEKVTKKQTKKRTTGSAKPKRRDWGPQDHSGRERDRRCRVVTSVPRDDSSEAGNPPQREVWQVERQWSMKCCLPLTKVSSKASGAIAPKMRRRLRRVLRFALRGEGVRVHGCFFSQSLWKAGSVRNESQMGSSFKKAGVMGAGP